MKLSEEQKVHIEEQLAEFPLFGYGYLPVSEISFLDQVRYICETECPQYGKSWSCPPAVGTVEECKTRVNSYEEVFLFASVSEVESMDNMQMMLATRREHENVARQITDIFREAGCETLTLSTESCIQCQKCTYPDAPCRHPERQFPCVESYGIMVVELAEKCGIPFIQEYGVITWFSAIILR